MSHEVPLFAGRQLTFSEVINALTSSASPYSVELGQAAIAATKKIASSCRAKGFKLGAKGLTGVLTKNGWSLVRVFVATPSLKEYEMGLYRLKPSVWPSESDRYVYAIYHHGKITTYIFRSHDVSDTKSLNLRFKDFERRCAYRFAQDRWDIL